MAFAKSIKAYSDKVALQVDASITKKADRLFRAVVSFSPKRPAANYSKGEFINNWMVQSNGISGATRSTHDDNGIGSLNDIAEMWKYKTFYKRDGKVTMTNNTHYTFRVEYAGWPSPEWSGRVMAYAPVAKAFISMKGRP